MTARFPILWLSIPLIALAACNNNKENAPSAVAPEEVIATVDGKPISRSQFDLYLETISRQSGREIPEEQHPQLLDQFISMRLAAEVAEKAGIAEQTKVQDQLELARMNVIVDAGLQKYLEDNPVTDEDIKPEYDAQVASMPREYRARHILVEDKASADTITKQLKAGADFAKLASAKSKDSSAKSGGDLNWFTPESMVKPFADAVVALEPGAITEEPVQSQFGWHVIKLEETRASSPPPFDEVKDQVKVLVQRKKLQVYLEELRAAAEVEKTL
jgi:peptidyl-prolyl cis-trans isomerase C